MIEGYICQSPVVIPLINMLKTVIHCSRQLAKPFNTLVDFLVVAGPGKISQSVIQNILQNWQKSDKYTLLQLLSTNLAKISVFPPIQLHRTCQDL